MTRVLELRDAPDKLLRWEYDGEPASTDADKTLMSWRLRRQRTCFFRGLRGILAAKHLLHFAAKKYSCANNNQERSGSILPQCAVAPLLAVTSPEC